MRRYIDEYIEPEERRWLISPDEIAMDVLRLHNEGKSSDEIAIYIEEKYYVFEDEEEHEWNKKVVENIINNKPVKNRWSNYEYKMKTKLWEGM